MDDDDAAEFPTDVLAHILERLRRNDRRRLRLVCQHWRHVVDTRTATSLRSRAKTLIVTVERAYVFDDDLSTCQRSWEMPVFRNRYGSRGTNEVVGICNGIICVCDDFGGIHVYNPNPIVGGTLTIPSLQLPYRTGGRMWRQTFGFTHDQATGRYMVVHVQHHQVMVFTLGEAAWREVIIPYVPHISGCTSKNGFVTVDGTMYWAAEGKRGSWKVVSFDIHGESAPSAIPLPSPKPAGTWNLTQVLGRLGMVTSKEVWVMERGASAEAKDTRWSLWYSVQVWRARHQPQWHDRQHLTWPHFAHGSNHVLTWEWLPTGDGCALYRHTASDDTTKARRGTVQINQMNQGMLVAHIDTKYDTFMRVDFVETMEPLGVYKFW